MQTWKNVQITQITIWSFEAFPICFVLRAFGSQAV